MPTPAESLGFSLVKQACNELPGPCSPRTRISVAAAAFFMSVARSAYGRAKRRVVRLSTNATDSPTSQVGSRLPTTTAAQWCEVLSRVNTNMAYGGISCTKRIRATLFKSSLGSTIVRECGHAAVAFRAVPQSSHASGLTATLFVLLGDASVSGGSKCGLSRQCKIFRMPSSHLEILVGTAHERGGMRLVGRSIALFSSFDVPSRV